MEVAELAGGLWRWTARHPGWTPEEGGPDGWGPDVASVYCETRGDLLLIDPLVPGEEGERSRFWRALDRDVRRLGAPTVLLTCAWHARSSRDVIDRYPAARVWVHPEGLADVPSEVAAHVSSRPGDRLPGGVEAIDGVVGRGEVLLWLPSHSALVAGDTLLGGGPEGIRLCPDPWLGGADPVEVRAAVAARLAPLPVERLLPAHGEPVLAGARRALERALALDPPRSPS